MRAPMVWAAIAVMVLASCGGSDGGDDAAPEDAPTVSITGLSVDEVGGAFLEYAFADDGPVRVEIDWGDGSPLQGFTGESGTFTSRHFYDTVTTSVVVTVVTTDADGNASAATRTVDLSGGTPDATAVTVASTVPETTVIASTVLETTAPPTSTTTTTSSTTTTTAPPAPPPPPPPPDPTTTTSTTTTTAPPRQYVVTVRGDLVRVVGDCDSVGQGDFLITGAFDTDRSAPASFSIGTFLNPEQLGDNETRDISSRISTTGAVTDGQVTEWEAVFTATEYDPLNQDPFMNGLSDDADGTISTARSPIRQRLSVGSEERNCQVDMTILVTAEFVD